MAIKNQSTTQWTYRSDFWVQNQCCWCLIRFWRASCGDRKGTLPLVFKQIKQKLWIKSLPAQSEFAKFLNAFNIPVAWEDTSMTGQWHLPCHQILYTVAFTTCHHAFGWAIENIICWHRSRCTPVPKTNQQRKGNLLWDVGLVPILGN